MSTIRRPKICGIITKAFGIKAFMQENLRYAAQKEAFDSFFICERTDEFSPEDLRSLTYIPVDMQRGNVSPLEVARCIAAMYRIFRRERFDIIQFASSNAGLYASIAGWLARVPVRVYCQWGISYTDYTGPKLAFYKFMEWLTCRFATHVQPDSHANLHFAVSEGLYKPSKGSVIHRGSASGVDVHRFDIQHKATWRKEIRKQYSIPQDAFVFGFVGRLVPEKGINELFRAFIDMDNPRAWLMIVGPNYEVERLDQDLWEQARKHPRIVFCGSQSNTAPFYAAMDFLVLPSYREGFGTVVLEAGALAVPSVCTDIKGPTEYVKDHDTGLLCKVMDPISLLQSMQEAISMSAEDYAKLSQRAYDVVLADYEASTFRQHYLNDRLRMLKNIK